MHFRNTVCTQVPCTPILRRADREYLEKQLQAEAARTSVRQSLRSSADLECTRVGSRQETPMQTAPSQAGTMLMHRQSRASRSPVGEAVSNRVVKLPLPLGLLSCPAHAKAPIGVVRGLSSLSAIHNQRCSRLCGVSTAPRRAVQRQQRRQQRLAAAADDARHEPSDAPEVPLCLGTY